MKNFTNNFKQFTSRLSARWLIMALMMLVGTSSAWGAVKLYLSPSANWKQADAYFAAYFYGNGEKWVKMSYDSNSGYYVCDDPTTYPNVIFCRMNPSGTDSNNNYLNWNNRWHQTSDLTGYSTNGNCYAIKEGTWDKGGGTWSTYTPPCDVTLSVSKNPDANIYLTSESVTLTATATNQTSITWKKGDTTLGTDNSYAYTQSEVGNVTIKAIAANTTCNVEKTVDLAFVNQKAIKITTNGNYYLYTWNGDNTDGTKNWPGIKGTHEGDVYVWTIETTKPINAILNNGKNQPQTADINNLQVGYEYYLEWNGTGSAFVSTDDKEELPKPCTTADVQITSDPSNICPGGSTTFTYTAAAGANITWKMESASSAFAFTDNNGTVTVTHSTPSTIVNGANKILYTVADANDICPASDVDTEKTITLLSVPSITASTSTDQNICYGTEATLTVTGNQGTYTWVSSDGGEAIDSKTNSVTVSKAGTYTVTAQNAGGCTSNKITFTVTVKDPVAAPTLNPNSATVCGGEPFELPNIDGVTWSLDGKTTTGRQSSGIANNTDAAIIKTFQAVKEVDGCPSAPADYKVTVNPTPVITGESVAQPGKANAINLKLQGNLVADWSVNPTADLSYTTNSNSTNFSAETNGTYTIKATTEKDCFATHVVTVADAFYIYFRNAKEGETAYGNFYHPDQNTEEYRGGAMYYAESTVLPTSGTVANFNQGGKEADIITTDCDGYTWYGFKASADVISGSKYFYVHAKNNINKAGWYTHTVPTKVTLTSDVYYTLCETSVNECNEGSKGWKIVEASAPYAGPKVYASGSTTLGTDKFAALYVTDCSGKEIKSYQWYNNENVYDSKCEYVTKDGQITGDAGKTNNIRPAIAGNYSCTVTYEDGTTATSAAVEISGSYNRSFTSTIPVLVVNTGDKDFPGCQASGTDNYPSKYAEKLKAKRSVDVKIYDGKGALVYDRKARMAYRGSSSLNFTKKSYAFCPGDANCGDKDKGEDYVKTAELNMLGVGKACDKDWVLYAAAADPSLMRNRMVFDTYQAMRPNDWGVHSRYVELIINGEYKGVYVFMDKITMNKERVKVDEDKGFIVKFDKTDCADRVDGYNGIFGDQKTFSTERTGRYDISTYHTTVDQLFEIEYPEKDDYPTGWANKVASIKGMFQAFEDALEAGDYATVQKYIDYDSWADWFIINEFTKNLDAYRASCIFVYTGEAGAKIEARPLWDQELSFNNAAAGLTGKGANSTSGLLIQNDGVYTDCFPAPFWFTGQLATFGTCGGNNGSGAKGEKLANCLLNDPCFVQVVKEKWNQHQFGALSAEELGKLITKYDDELGYTEKSGSTILKRESTKWPDDFRTSADCSAGGTGYNKVSYSDSKTAITNWISDDATKGRRAGLTTAINGLTGASFSIQIIPSEAKTTPWEPVEIEVSVTPAGYDYKLEYTDNDLGSVANTIIKEEGDKITYRIPRPSAWGTGDAEEGERTDIEYGIKATLSVQDGTTVCGTQAAPSSTAKIILQDEPNDNCK